MEARDFTNARRAVGGLLICTGVLCAAGILSLLPELRPTLSVVCVIAFAGLAVFALWVAQEAAGCAQALSGRDYRGSRVAAILIAVICGLVSVAGSFLSHAVMSNEPIVLPPLQAMIAGGFALAFIKPGMGFTIAACEQKAGGDAAAHDALLEERRRRIDQLERDLAAAHSKIEQLGQRQQIASDQAARTVAKALTDQRPSPQRGRAAAPEPRKRSEGGAPIDEQTIRDALAAMTKDVPPGADWSKVVSINKVRQFLGVPYSRVERSPHRHLIEEAVRFARIA